MENILVQGGLATRREHGRGGMQAEEGSTWARAVSFKPRVLLASVVVGQKSSKRGWKNSGWSPCVSIISSP